jgi:hypothetical protein
VKLEHCECSLESLRKFLPEALKSVSSAAINRYYYRCMRILNAFDSAFRHGTKTFKDHVYKGHRISRSGRHVIIYVSLFPFIVSVRVVATDIWRSPPPKILYFIFFNALKPSHHTSYK